MDDTSPKRRWSWPLAFFFLNALALLAWFAIHGLPGGRELTVVGVTPSGNDVDPAAVAEILVRYSSPLQPDSVKANSLRFSPPLPGISEPAGSAIRFSPSVALRPATTYTIIPGPDIRGENGETPRSELLEFSTTRLRLLSAAQTGYDRESFTIELAFNQPVSPRELEKHVSAIFSVSKSGSAPDRIQVVGNTTDRRQRLRIRERRNCFLKITLPAGLSGVDGPLGLEADATLLYHITGLPGDNDGKRPEWAAGMAAEILKPEVEFTGVSAEWEDGSGVIRVRTTSPLDPAGARDFVSVSPEIPVTFASAWNGIKILGDFQPGKQYRVTLKKGAPSTSAGDLNAEISRTVWFDDLPPHLSFTHGGGFLSPEGLLKVPVKTRNLDAFRLEMRRLYASNIVESILKEYGAEAAPEYSEPEIRRRIETSGTRNREKEILLDLRDLVGGQPLGVYGLVIAREDRSWDTREAMIAVSDLGLGVRAGRETMLVWATSIREGAPREGVLVSVYSNKRQHLADASTDAHGIATLELPSLPDGERPALVLGEGDPGEYSFVRLDRDNRSRGVQARQGSAYPDAYEIFLTAERGVYRGGETVLITGLARDADLADAPGLPLELRLLGPDGKELKTASVKADTHARLAHELVLGESYASGIYTLEARIPGQTERLGAAMFRIADYMPETLSIAMELNPEKGDGDQEQEGDGEDIYDPENRLLIKVSRLAGGELERIPVTVMASYSSEPFAPKDWDGWRFGDDRLRGRVADGRQREAVLGSDGTVSVDWKNPALNFPAAAVMTIRVEASETGGRAASESVRRVVHPVAFYTGVRPPEANPQSGVGNRFQLAAVSPSGGVRTSAAAGWSGVLSRVEYTGVMKKMSNDRIGYEWVRQEIPEEEFEGAWENGRAEITVTPRAGGRYRLTLDAPGGKGCAFDFTVSGPGSGWHGEDPETLTLEPDKASYRVDEEAVVSIASPFAGKALVTVETDRVLSHWLEDFKEGDNEVRVAVTDAMRPNAHVGVTLIRPALAEAEWRPHRLSGNAVLKVDNTDRRLQVKFDAPDHFAPGKTAEIRVLVTHDGKPAGNAPVVVWAVDMGVLSLTGFRTPSPWDLFYGLRRSGVSEADMFSRLAPELTAWLGSDPSPGGGAADDELSRRLNPVFASRVKAAVVHEASTVTDAAGRATVQFAIPEFAGRLRMMCWAAHADRMGAGEVEVEVKAPVAVLASWPRFAAPGDVMEIPVTVINRSGKRAVARVTHETGDNLTLVPEYRELELDDNASGVVTFRATCGEAGVARAAISAGMGGEGFTERVEFSVRPPLLFTRESGVVTLAPGEEKTIVLAPGIMEKNSRVKLVAGGHPLINLTGSIEYLLDYPYGCAEQTASRLLALVYLPDLVALARPGQLESGELRLLATACIERLSTMQSANGSIKTWPNGGEELFWVSSQALYSLLESRSSGHPVPETLVNNLARYLDSRLEHQFEGAALDADGGEAVAMACLALARAEKLKRSWLLRFEEIAETRANSSKPLSSAALGFFCEAVAVAGDPDAATRLYHHYKPMGESPGRRTNRVVELGAWLLASMALGVDVDEQAMYANELGSIIKDGFTYWSTKENSLILTALGRYWQKVGPIPEATAFFQANGVKTNFSTRRGAALDKLKAGARVEVGNPAEGSLRLFWLAEGAPLSGKVREEDVGMAARRRLFDRTGREVQEPFELNRGEVYEVRLSITGDADDLVLVDLLPAGLEIEDAALKGRKQNGNASKGLSVKNVEIRDDRLLIFAAVHGSGEYRYLARAVTGGRFAWPALDASRMYDAATRSVHGAGEMTVKDKVANDM